MAKYFFNPKGVDFDGNPDWADEKDGWVVLECPNDTWEEAIAQIPKAAQTFIKKEMKKEGASNFAELLECTCGWGHPFTLYNQDDFDSVADNTL